MVVGWLVDVVGRLCGQSLWNAWTAVSTVWDGAYTLEQLIRATNHKAFWVVRGTAASEGATMFWRVRQTEARRMKYFFLRSFLETRITKAFEDGGQLEADVRSR